jgi:hypothetical protein
MELLLKIMGGALGIIVPVLFIWVLLQGLSRTAFDVERKRLLRGWIIGVIGVWTVAIWAASLFGMLEYYDGDRWPRFAVALIVPVVAGFALLKNSWFAETIEHTPVSTLVGAQTFRLAGFAFLLVERNNMLPSAFASGGYGDIVTGTLAIAAALALSRGARGASSLFWAFSIAGLADLMNVAVLLLLYYPIWWHGSPSSAAAAKFSLVMIPALAAPIALLLHGYAILQFCRSRSAVPQ